MTRISIWDDVVVSSSSRLPGVGDLCNRPAVYRVHLRFGVQALGTGIVALQEVAVALLLELNCSRHCFVISCSLFQS